jgi:hypothetical protein
MTTEELPPSTKILRLGYISLSNDYNHCCNDYEWIDLVGKSLHYLVVTGSDNLTT